MSKCRPQGPIPLVPSYKPPTPPLATAVGRPHLHGIPQLVGQVVWTDAIWEALRQQHGSEARKRGRRCPGSPVSRFLPGFRCRGPGEPAPAPSTVPLQAPVGGSAAAARGSGAELFRAQLHLQARRVSHPQVQPDGPSPTRQKAGRITFPVRLRRPQRGNHLPILSWTSDCCGNSCHQSDLKLLAM